MSPPGLFNKTVTQGPTLAQSKQRLWAYDASRKRIAGEVTIRQVCDAGGTCAAVAELVLRNGDVSRLEVEQWSSAGYGLVSRRKPEPGGKDRRWAALSTPFGLFWIQTASENVHLHENLVQVVEDPWQWCSSAKKCSAMNYSTAQEMRRVAEKVGCTGSPYRVVGVVSTGGRRLYRLELAQPLPPDVVTWLPRSGFVPVRDREGQHTGTFYPQGC